MAGDERIRLFCAVRLPESTVDALAEWQHLALDGGRIVPRSNLHLTLAFLGSRPAGDVPLIVDALAEAAAGARGIRLRVRRYRETRSVGMLVLDDEHGHAVELAARLHELLERHGVYEREARPWLPHITVLRFRTRPRLDPPVPDLGVVAPSDAAVYISRLRPGGAEYEILESVALGHGETG